MAGQTERIAFKRDSDEDVFVQYTEKFEAPGTTKAMKRQRSRLPEDGVHLQIAGTATDIAVVVERTTNDPTGPNPNWAPPPDDPITGDIRAGFSAFAFSAPGRVTCPVSRGTDRQRGGN